MSNTVKPTKAAALAHVTALIAGTQEHTPNGSFTLGNVTYTTASLVGLLQELVAAMTALNAAQAGSRDARSSGLTGAICSRRTAPRRKRSLITASSLPRPGRR